MRYTGGVRAARFVPLIVLVVLAVYLVLVHNANPAYLNLPFMLSLPPALVIAVALLLGWLIGWLPSRAAVWRRGRELRRLRRRLDELEQHVPSYDNDHAEPVIPDRFRAAPPERPGDPERS